MSSSFGVGPDIRIRAARSSDIAAIVRIHNSSFPDAFVTSLGPQLLSQYYRHLTHSPRGIAIVAVVNDQVVGFVAGFVGRGVAGSSFPTDFIPRQLPSLLVIAPFLALRLLRVRGGAARVLRRIITFGHAPGVAAAATADADLTSLATDPQWRRRGVGARLVTEFLHAARQHGAHRVLIGAQASAPHVVNLYLRNGFKIAAETLNVRGQRVIELVKTLGEEHVVSVADHIGNRESQPLDRDCPTIRQL